MSEFLDRLRKQLKRDEGLRLHLYKDTVGKWTIGIGRNLSDGGISEEEALHLLDNDVATVIGELVTRFPWFESLDPVRQCVLINMGFNMGVPKLAKFVVTLAYVKKGNYEEAAVSMLQSRWAEQVGDRALRLAQQMRTGEFV